MYTFTQRRSPLRTGSSTTESAIYPATWAAAAPNKIAQIILDPDETLTYGELDERSARLAGLFSFYGLERGDHIAVCLENHPRYLEIAWGALAAGLYLTTISTYSTTEDVAYIVDNCQAKIFISSAQMSDVVVRLPSRVTTCRHWLMVDGAVEGFQSYEKASAAMPYKPIPPDAPAGDFMFYSSGTTGRPKGVLRPLTDRTAQEGTMFNAFLSKVLTIDQDSIYLSPAPLYHSAPMASVVAATSLGATVIIMRKFDPVAALAAIEKFHVTHSQWVPTMFVRMLRLPEEDRARFDLNSHRVAVHSAAPCPVHIKRAMINWWGPILHEYYNGTENAGATYVGPRDWLSHPGTVGRPLGFTIHVCDDEGHELPAGQSGRIYVERPTATFEYHGDPDKTRGSRHREHSNWMTLDDVGYVDDDGFLYLTDRASFMIISGGVNIYPREIEDCLLRHPAVADVAVIGTPHDEMGEEVTALVELAQGTRDTPELVAELNGLAREYLSGPKRPRVIEFVSQLPRLPNGKLAKADLRNDYRREYERRVRSATVPATVHRL